MNLPKYSFLCVAPKVKVDKKKSVFDRLGEEQKTTSRPEVHPPSLKPLKTSTVTLKTAKVKC